MNETPELYVLDTSALLTLIEDEPGADVVQDVLQRSREGKVGVLVSFMSFMEVHYITLQERDADEARVRVDLITSLPVLRVESTESLGQIAGELKAEHRLSVADAWIAALAKERNAVLIHKDPDFEHVKSLQVLALPYKVVS